MAQKRNATTNYVDPRDSKRPAANTGTKKAAPKKETNKPQRPVKQTMTFPIVAQFTYDDKKAGETIVIEHSDVMGALQTLIDNGAFKLLTQNVSMSRVLMNGDPEAHGNAIVGFINDIDFDPKAPTAELMIYGASVGPVQDFLNAGGKLCLEPRLVCVDGKFRCFNGFFLVEDESK